jgi:hypothetical protein
VDLAIELVERSRIKARGADATIYEVIEYQMVITSTIDCAVKTTKSGLVYKLDDGRDVHRATARLFHVVDSDLLIERI